MGRGFNPEIGFLRRDNFDGSVGVLRFSPRPASIEAIRQLTWEGRVDPIADRAGLLEAGPAPRGPGAAR